MQVASRQRCLLILLFGAVFLASQLHYCCELTVTPSASHLCPLCSTAGSVVATQRSEEHTSELQSHSDLVCRLLLEKKKNKWVQCSSTLSCRQARFFPAG